MTFDEPAIDQPTADAADPVASSVTTLPRRPGLWRVISMLVAVAALAITALSVLQARSAGDVAVADKAPVLLETTVVTVTDLPLLGLGQVATLGLSSSESVRPFESAGTTLEIPQGRAAVVALTADDDSLIGLRLVSPDEDRSAIEISARSTARTLLALSPGVLRPDPRSTLLLVDGYSNDPAFEDLVEAVRLNPNLSTSNEALESAYAAIADRVRAQEPAADQGCDSVSARTAYPSAGACVQPTADGAIVTNEQDRWALVFAEAGEFTRLCGVVAPTNTANAEITLSNDDCPGNALIVAPGPQSDQGADGTAIQTQVRTAAAFNLLYDYAGPFADLAGAGAGFTDNPVSDLSSDADSIATALRDLVIRSEEFAAAMDVSLIASTPLDRNIAHATAARLIIDAADFTSLIPQRTPGDIGHLPILDFYSRSAERMLSQRIDWRWEADSVGRIALEAGG